MTTLVDLPPDIINIAIPLSNLDRKMLKYTCQLFLKIIPVQRMFYDEPAYCPFEQKQLELMLSPQCIQKRSHLSLAKNAIKRSRIDLLQSLIPHASQYDLSDLRRTAAMVGDLEVYKHLFALCPVADNRYSDDREALSYGHLNIFNYLEANYLTRRDENGLGASVGAIRSGKLEIVINIFNRGYTFGEFCVQHANNLDIIKWLHGKGFIVDGYTVDEMAKRGDLGAIKWFDEMKIRTQDEICRCCLLGRFVNGVKYLLDTGYTAKPHQLESYKILVEQRARPWYEWLKRN